MLRLAAPRAVGPLARARVAGGPKDRQGLAVEQAFGRLLKMIGDGVAIATIVFIGSVFVASRPGVDWPPELDVVPWIAEEMLGRFGPAWWMLVIALGAVIGVALGNAGRRILVEVAERRRHYR